MKKFHKDLFIVLGLVVFQITLWFFYYSIIHSQIYFDDVLEVAQTAKNVIEGKGYSMNSYSLIGLDYLKKEGLLGENWQNLQKAPLPIFILAGLFKVFGYSDFTITMSSAIPYFVVIPILFFLARNVFKIPVLPTIVACIILVTNQIFFEGSFLGHTEALAASFYMLFIFFLLQHKQKYSFFALGIIGGLAYLNRQESLLWFITAVLLYYLTNRKRLDVIWKPSLWFLIIALPWLAYMFSVVGNPLFTLQGELGILATTKSYPHFLNYELESVNPFIFIVTKPWEILEKWVMQAWFFLRGLPDFLKNPYSLAFFVVWLIESQKKNEQKLKSFLLVHFIVIAFFAFLFIPEPRYFLFLLPFIILFGTKVYFEKIQQFRKTPILFLFLVLLYLIFSSIRFIGFINDYKNKQAYRFNRDELSYISQVFKKDDVLVSNLPRAVGWYSDTRAVTLPKKPQDIKIVEQRYFLIDGIYLVSRKVYPWLSSWEDSWAYVEDQTPKSLENFKLLKVFPSGSLLYKKNEKRS